MEKFPVGTYIRQRRQDLGLTQEELCKSLNLSVSTLSRVENGRYNPSLATADLLFGKLGLPSGLILQLAPENEIEIDNLQDEIHNNAIRFRRASMKDRPKIREGILEDLKKLEEMAGDGNPYIQQFILSMQVSVGGPEGPFPPKKRLSMLMKAIKLTVPRFSLDKLLSFRYAKAEVTIIIKIAKTYAGAGDRKKAIDILSQLLQYIEKNKRKISRYSGHFCAAAHNCAIYLGLEKQYEQSIALARKGWETCIKYGDYQFLAGFLAILGECYYFLGDIPQSTDFYHQARTIYRAVRDENNLSIIEQEMKERLGIAFPDHQ